MNSDKSVLGRSFWLETCPITEFPELKKGLEVDVVILGGGIAGLTTAILLKEAGLTVAVIEADRIVKEVTAGTTAKISVAPNLVYNRLISNLGKSKAQEYANANIEAFNKIVDIIEKYDINCEFKYTPLYIYTESEDKTSMIKAEFKAVQELGIEASLVDEVPLPFNISLAIKYDNQAQFHPRKYLLALSNELASNGSYVFEQTPVITVKNGEKKEVLTEHGTIIADKVVITTHIPIYDPDLLYKHLHQERSYVTGVYATEKFPNGMFIDFEPLHTYRTTPTEKGELILVAGEHSPVNIDDMDTYCNRLKDYAMQHLKVNSVEYCWSDKDSVTDDGLPMIGLTSQSDIYVATGFGFWGMTNGTTAAMVISGMVLSKENKFTKLFNPLRFQVG